MGSTRYERRGEIGGGRGEGRGGYCVDGWICLDLGGKRRWMIARKTASLLCGVYWAGVAQWYQYACVLPAPHHSRPTTHYNPHLTTSYFLPPTTLTRTLPFLILHSIVYHTSRIITIIHAVCPCDPCLVPGYRRRYQPVARPHSAWTDPRGTDRTGAVC